MSLRRAAHSERYAATGIVDSVGAALGWRDAPRQRYSCAQQVSRGERRCEFDACLRNDRWQLIGGLVRISGVITQLRTTNLAESIRFYTTMVGCTLEFQHEDFYAGIRAGNQVFHLKLVDEKDPAIAFVHRGEHFHLYFETDDVLAAAEALKRNGVLLARDVHETAWGTREFVIEDDQGHTLYFGERQ